jgi:hypothetical protein
MVSTLFASALKALACCPGRVLRRLLLAGLAASVPFLTLNGCLSPSAPRANHAPVISSLIADPDSIGPQDSLIVTCAATDSDSDPLVYDWFTDRRLRIKGANPSSYLYSASHTQVFYYGSPVGSPDVAWITCYARDQRGLSSSRQVSVRLIK